jgi:hypothetical protein
MLSYVHKEDGDGRGRRKMTKTEIQRALRFEDETTETLIAALRNADDDGMYGLLEDIREAARASAIEDIKIDLADFGQTEAVEIIKANY